MPSIHRDQAHFGFANWRKRILLPCWIIQIPIQISLMGVFSYRLSNTISTYDDDEKNGQVPTVEFVWEVINIAFSLFAFIVNALQISKFIAEALTPFGMMVGNILCVTLSVAILVLDVVVYTQRTDRKYSIVALGLDCVLLLFTLIPAIYGVVVYRRMLMYDEYHTPHHNVKHFGFAKPEETAYDPQRGGLNVGPEAMYDAGAERPARSRGGSFTSIRRSLSFNPTPPEPASPPTRPELSRPSSYDHKRDTQFEDYVKRKSSTTLHEDVERALSAEFWGRDNQSDSTVLASGSVPTAQARPRADSRGRAASWTINFGDEDVNSAGAAHGHSLKPVAEGGEDEDDTPAALRVPNHRQVSDDRQGLLHAHTADRRVSGLSVGSYASSAGRTDARTSFEVVELNADRR